MLIAVWPLVFAIVGLLLYFVATNAKVQEVGRVLFFVGMLWLVYSLTGHALKLG
jgi:Na+/phosphate symporter